MFKLLIVNERLILDFKHGKSPYVQIYAKTWYRDSHGLFDYDSKNVVKSKVIKLFQSTFLNKMGDDRVVANFEMGSLINFGDGEEFSGKANSFLCSLWKSVFLLDSLVSVVYINGKYFLQNDKGYTWRVMKSPKRFPGMKIKPEKLSKGDIIKLGRYIFEVKEISSKSVNKDREEAE